MPEPTPRRTLSGQVPLSALPQPMPASAVMGAPHLAAPPPAPPPPPAEPVHDRMSKVVDLPSGGLYYASGTASVRVRPSRGEEELILAGTPAGSIERVRATRDLVSRCVTLSGLGFEELLALDYAHITTHFMGLTLGSDEIDVAPGCGKEACPLAVPVTLTTLPCVFLRAATFEHPVAVTPEAVSDPLLRAAMKVEQAEAEAKQASTDGRIFRRVDTSDREPFTDTLSDGTVVQWRYHRVRDLIAAEEFVVETGAGTEMGINAALGAYLSARQIVSVNGQPASVVTALQWWRKTDTPVLKSFRRAIAKRDFSFDGNPEFTCSKADCRRKVKVRINPESLFRV